MVSTCTTQEPPLSSGGRRWSALCWVPVRVKCICMNKQIDGLSETFCYSRYSCHFLAGGSCTYRELCEKSICLKCPCAAHEANYSRSNSLDLSQTLMFQFVRITSNAPDTDCHQGVKRWSFLWEAGGGRGFGKGLPLDESCQTPPHPPLKTSPLFYNPLLLSLSLCVVVKEPWSTPPTPFSAKGVVKCWRSPAQQSVAHLSPFNSPHRGMRGHKDHGLSGFFSSFKSAPSPKSVCFPFCVFVHSLTGKAFFFIIII